MKEKIKIKIIISKVNNFFLPFSLFSLNSETLSAVTNTPFPSWNGFMKRERWD